jgi:hypothetical protein
VDEQAWLDLAAWLACVDPEDVRHVLGREVLLPPPVLRLTARLGADWRQRPLFAELVLLADLADDLRREARRRERIARVSGLVAGLAPVAGAWLGARIGHLWLGLLLGGLWGGGLPAVLSAWSWREARQLRGLLAQACRVA